MTSHGFRQSASCLLGNKEDVWQYSSLDHFRIAVIRFDCKASTVALGDIPVDSTHALKRLDNIGIVVDDLELAIEFFQELGLHLEGWVTLEGEWAGRVTGLADQRGEIAMMCTPDGHSRLELTRFLTPPPVADHRDAPVNALGYLRVMFAVDNIDETLDRLRKRGAHLVGEVVQYHDS